MVDIETATKSAREKPIRLMAESVSRKDQQWSQLVP
jgi:hypothetical protein